LALIALSAIGFDLGLQSSLVAHQNLVYSLEPQARGRLNALLFTVVFIGMSLGSVLGSKLYVLAGWNGVVTLAVSRRHRPGDPPAGECAHLAAERSAS
jgi:MFS family permease